MCILFQERKVMKKCMVSSQIWIVTPNANVESERESEMKNKRHAMQTPSTNLVTTSQPFLQPIPPISTQI